MIVSCKQMMPPTVNQVHHVVCGDGNLRNRSSEMMNQISISTRIGKALEI